MPNQIFRRAAGAGSQALAGLLLLVLSLLAVVWWAPGLPYVGQDSAWVLALNQAVADRLRFGREVVFNLGPWGAVYAGQYHPATGGMMLAGGVLLALALAAGLAALARGWRRWIALLAPLLVATVGLRDPVFVAIPLLLLAVAVALAADARRAGSMPPGRLGVAALLLLVAACALLPFVKGTSGTQAVPMAALSLLALTAGRRFRLAAAALALFLAAAVGFWLAAGQRLADLPAYLGTAPLLISGYNEGAALDGTWTDIAAYLGAGFLLLWLCWRDRGRCGAPGGVLLPAGLLFTLFVAFKAGFVRHDEHALIALGSLALMPLVLARALRGRHLAPAVLAALCALAFVSGHYPDYRWPSWARARERFAGAAAGVWDRVADPGRLARGYAADMAHIRAVLPLPHVAGSADFYSSGQAILLASGLDWSPRPALQSETVYSGAMAQADLDHLQGTGGRGGPVQNVFYRVENEDNRLRSTEDGLSWPALLSAFAVRGYDRALDTALLQRLPGVAAVQPAGPALLDGEFRFGQDAMLPAAPPGMLWARLDIRPTLAGRLASFLFRPPILWIVIRYADGPVEKYRLLTGLARAGFLLTPRIDDTEDLLLALLPERRGALYRPVSVRIVGERGAGRLWRQTYRLRVEPVAIPVQPQVRKMLLAPLARVGDEPGAPVTDAPLTDAGACVIDFIDGQPPSAGPMDVAGSLRVIGWSAVSLARPGVADQVFVRLTGEAGDVWEAQAQRRMARLDVARALGNPGLAWAGFDAALDLSALRGRYALSVEVARAGRRLTCRAEQALSIGPPQG